MPDYGQQFYLTGHFGRPQAGITLAEIAAQWCLPPRTLTAIRRAVMSEASIVICAEESRVGKTLLLEALTAALPDYRPAIYLRGTFERFSFMAEHRYARASSVLVANEISDYEDVYLWGEPARRVLALAREGWTLWGTAHAASAPDLIESWLRAGLIACVHHLPERLVVISVEQAETFNTRALRFEWLRRGEPIDSRQWMQSCDNGCEDRIWPPTTYPE